MTGFEGYMQFNDVPHSQRVNVTPTGFSLHFSPADRVAARRVGLAPFPPIALVTLDADKMRSGFYYAIEGTEVGTCSEGGRHPEDREARIWPILAFTLAAKYTYEALTLGVSGRTGPGYRFLPATSDTEPWSSTMGTFRLEVRIPREAIATVLKLGETDKYRLYEKLDLLR